MNPLLLLLAGATAPPPPGVPVLAATSDYLALTQPEQAYSGRLRQKADGFRLFTLDGLGRASNFVELHAPGKAHLLVPLIEQNVRITGKVVPGTGGTRLWPGRIERPGRDGPGADGVIARAALTAGGIPFARAAVKAEAILSPEALATHLKIAGPTAGLTASKVLAARLGRASIDWRTQVLLKVDGGLAPVTRQVKITRVVKEGGTLVAYYVRSVRAGTGDGGFHNAGEFALVPRFDGTVTFREEGRSPKPGR